MGYGFELVHLDPGDNPRALQRQMLARGVVGVVFGPVKDTALVDAIDWAPFALVRCNNDTAHIGAQRVESDVFESAWRVTQNVLERGYRKPGLSLFRHAKGFEDDVRRLGAFRSALADSPGKHARSGPVFEHPGVWRRDAFLRWVREHDIDCVICLSVVEYFWMVEAGIRVPEEIAMVSMVCAGEEGNPVTGCYEDFAQITVLAFQLCDQLVRGRAHGLLGSPRSINVPCLWFEGITLPWKRRGSGSAKRGKRAGGGLRPAGRVRTHSSGVGRVERWASGASQRRSGARSRPRKPPAAGVGAE